MESFEIILADDHAVILEGVKAILKSHSRLKVKGDFSNSKSLLEFLSKDKVDLILLDIDIPGADKLNLLKKIKLRYPQTKVVIFTMHKGMNYFLEAKKLGADSYVLKSDLISFLPTILLKALKGEFYCSDELKQLLTKEYNKEIIKPKELEILSFIAQGMKYADISKQIGKSEKTIEYYVYKLYKPRHHLTVPCFQTTLLNIS